MIREAQFYDIPRITEIFKKAFPDSIDQIFGTMPSDEAFFDLFQFVLNEFPDEFLVEEEDVKVLGYVVAPVDASLIVKDAILGGYIFRAAWHWLTGHYGFGLRSALVMAVNKFALWRGTGKARETSESRILSIGVDPDHQGKGIGKKLMNAGMEILKKGGAEKAMLEVREENAAAIHIYKKVGFYEVGRFSDKGGVWIQMIAHLKPEEEQAA